MLERTPRQRTAVLVATPMVQLSAHRGVCRSHTSMASLLVIVMMTVRVGLWAPRCLFSV